jgi:hypothetical protein
MDRKASIGTLIVWVFRCCEDQPGLTQARIAVGIVSAWH